MYQSTFSNQLAVYGLLPAAPPPNSVLIATGFETSDVQPSFLNSSDVEYNASPESVVGYFETIPPECSPRTNEVAHSGASALMFSGTANGGAQAYDNYRVFQTDFAITDQTSMRYWLYPEDDNPRYVSMDLHCTDGRTLRDSGATALSGISVYPQVGHGGDSPLATWNRISSKIGTWLPGCHVNKSWIAFDRPAATGQFRGHVDDLTITNDPPPQ